MSNIVPTYRVVNGFPGYEVSDMGAVRRVNGRNVPIGLSGNGYYYVHIHNADGQRMCVSVHRLVAEMFCYKPNSTEKLQVDHINGFRNCNIASNLRWVTQKENLNNRLKVHANPKVTQYVRRKSAWKRISSVYRNILNYDL